MRLKTDLTIWFPTTVALLCAFLSIMDIQITNAAIEVIQAELGASVEDGSWITSSYLIAEIISMPLLGYLLGRYSLKGLSIVLIILFLFASILCANAWSLPSMIVFRFLQGLVGGLMIPLAYSVIMLTLPDEKHLKAMAFFGLTSSLAPAIGPYLAGVLTVDNDFSKLFYINIPIGCIAIVMILLSEKEYEKRPKPFITPLDKVGIFLITIALLALLYFFEAGHKEGYFDSSTMKYTFLIGLATLIIFIIHQLEISNPLINLRLLYQYDFAIACFTSFVAGASIFGCIFLIPYYLISIHNYSPQQIANVILLMALPQILLMPVFLKLFKKLKQSVLIGLGCIIFSWSCFICSTMSIDFAYDSFIIPQLLRAIGLPMIMIPLGMLAMSGIAKEHSGSASIIYNISRSLGGAFGVAILVSLVGSYSSGFKQQLMTHLSSKNIIESADSNMIIYLKLNQADIASSTLDNQINTLSLLWAFDKVFLNLAMLLLMLACVFFLKSALSYSCFKKLMNLMVYIPRQVSRLHRSDN